ncbi:MULTISPECIES: type II toxin-antitoxin system HipA family toxin [Brevibacterium]|uniref:HipA domain-containing protein n=1 Tax=Brevibacterium salitolerans TaxID=1403566 RepID=A0ABN2X0P2_9MICO|nr:type II toxin-antitoxin system HipA family toxin [Brevibacterium sp.]
MTESASVFVELGGAPVRAGMAFFHVARRRVTTTFSYATDYLRRTDAYAIDPRLPLIAGPASVEGLPGAFQDCSPDRWGRTLVEKQFRREAQERGQARRDLSDVDFLLGVSDETRQGALRFTRGESSEFVAAHVRVPPVLSLPRVQRAADRAVAGDGRAIQELLEAGTGSLGGARPKAAVTGDDGRLLLAKFTRPAEDRPVIEWEQVALRLAGDAGIPVPRSRLIRIESRPVLLLDRFDRAERGARIGYMSAMTAAERRDGEYSDYLDVVSAIEEHSADWRADAAQMFRRVVFSAAIHNTDDHLRNHGFLRTDAGWRLSPVFDVNPDPDPDSDRQTAVMGATGGNDEAEAVVQFAEYCGLAPHRAAEVIMEVDRAVARWADTAREVGLAEPDIREAADGLEIPRRRLRAALEAAAGS